MKPLLPLLALLLLTGAGCTLAKNEPAAPPEPEPIFCTQDAMQCPDGSYVGRTGPNCEFVCPQTK